MQALLARRFPDAEIVSLDASRAERANGNEFGLIFSNGDLDLLPSLRELLPALVTRLSFGGSLSVQIPNKLYEPNRALLRIVAADGPWAKKLLPVAKTRPFNEMMEGLYALLSPACASVDIWETTYLCALEGVGAIIDLIKATSLAPFLRPLDETSRGRFLIAMRPHWREHIRRSQTARSFCGYRGFLWWRGGSRFAPASFRRRCSVSRFYINGVVKLTDADGPLKTLKHTACFGELVRDRVPILLDRLNRAAGSGPTRFLHCLRPRAGQGAECAQQAGVLASPFFVFG
jgi:trans-aconitate methyltransferase